MWTTVVITSRFGFSATHSIKGCPAALPAIFLLNHLSPQLQCELHEGEDNLVAEPGSDPWSRLPGLRMSHLRLHLQVLLLPWWAAAGNTATLSPSTKILAFWQFNLMICYPAIKMDLDFPHYSFVWIVFISPTEPEASQWQRPHWAHLPPHLQDLAQGWAQTSEGGRKQTRVKSADTPVRQTWLQLQLHTYHLCNLEQRHWTSLHPANTVRVIKVPESQESCEDLMRWYM